MVDFSGKILFIDTAPLIYFMEAKEPWFEKLLPIFEANDVGDFQFITSSLTLEEVLVAPIRDNEQELILLYEEVLLQSKFLNVVNIDTVIAKKAAELRVKYNVKTPDALQLATALIHEVDIFFTNDKGLRKVEELIVLTLDELLI